jgi:ArsR family transcriptional regulator
MNQPAATSVRPDALLGWMESLADPTRLRLLRVLQGHALGVVDLCDVLQLPQSTISRHLKVLSDQRWVRSERRGTMHLYRVTLDELDPSARRLWVVVREQMQNWPAARHDDLRLERRLRQQQDDSQAFFANKVRRWDKMRTDLYGQRFTRDALLALLPSTWTVADLGCGTGQVTAELAPQVSRVIGVDNSAQMLNVAKRRLASHANVELRRGDLQALPIDDATCDAAIMVLALTYVPEPSIAVAQTARILKPAGRAVIVDLLPHDREDFRRQMGQHSPGFDPAEITRMMRDAGFDNPHLRTLPPEPNAKGPALFLATGSRT